MNTTLPLDWAPLRSVAEAKDALDLLRASHASTFQVRRLLADLSLPASRDVWLRWLGAQVGLVDTFSPPIWDCGPRGVTGRAIWQLTSERVTVFFTDHRDGESGLRIVSAPGITTITYPTEAFRCALLAMEPE